MVNKGDSASGAIEKGMRKALIIQDLEGGAMALAARQGLHNMMFPVAGVGGDDITLEGQAAISHYSSIFSIVRSKYM